MIAFNEAVSIAKKFLADSEYPVEITFVDRFTHGWYFCFQSLAYLETGEFSEQLVGNAPFLIDKDTGSVVFLGTAHPIDFYLREYEQKKEADQK